MTGKKARPPRARTQTVDGDEMRERAAPDRAEEVRLCMELAQARAEVVELRKNLDASEQTVERLQARLREMEGKLAADLRAREALVALHGDRHEAFEIALEALGREGVWRLPKVLRRMWEGRP